ncbi:MAG: hypothetical protein ACYC5M_09865 [Anaerolineae bacterium]
MDEKDVDALLKTVTASRLKELLPTLAVAQSAGNRAAISLPDIVDALTRGMNLGTGAEGWAVQLRLKQAIKNAVAQIPDMRYVEGDA